MLITIEGKGRVSGYTSLAEILLSQEADVDTWIRGETALHLAVYNGQYSMTQLLLENGADADAELKGRTALQAARRDLGATDVDLRMGLSLTEHIFSSSHTYIRLDSSITSLLDYFYHLSKYGESI